MGKITVDREENTDYLFAGFLERELAKHDFYKDEVRISIEPRTGNIQFCQDYSFNTSPAPGFVFYALPSWRKDHQKIMKDNCALVTYAAEPNFHKPKPVEKKYDVGFVGRRYYTDRTDMLDAVISNFNTVVYESLPGDQLPDRLSECRVLFNHTRPEIDVNLRFFESMALGCQVMLKTPSLNEFAVDGVHYFSYSSAQECIEVIKKLLKDEDLRQKTIYHARSHFLSNHTYAHRAQSIINHLTEYYENTNNRG